MDIQALKGAMKMTANTIYSYIDSPLGQIVVRGDGELLTGLFIAQHKRWHGPDISWQQADEPFLEIRGQLAEYFAGQRREFTVPLRLVGTPFQRRVWQELVRIPFGTTISYAQLAGRIGQPTATRAVGHANGRNPIAILVPCHRVIGANGKLTGYASGIDQKQWLLNLERRAVVSAQRGHSSDAFDLLSGDNASESQQRFAEFDSRFIIPA
jgi:methylated-DNA-[protein]-cysteine S-methyltransferase